MTILQILLIKIRLSARFPFIVTIMTRRRRSRDIELYMEDFRTASWVGNFQFLSHYQQQTTPIFIMIDKYLRPQNWTCTRTVSKHLFNYFLLINIELCSSSFCNFWPLLCVEQALWRNNYLSLSALDFLVVGVFIATWPRRNFQVEFFKEEFACERGFWFSFFWFQLWFCKWPSNCTFLTQFVSH